MFTERTPIWRLQTTRCTECKTMQNRSSRETELNVAGSLSVYKATESK